MGTEEDSSTKSWIAIGMSAVALIGVVTIGIWYYSKISDIEDKIDK